MPFKMVLFWVDIRSFSEAVTCTEAPETLKFKKCSQGVPLQLINGVITPINGLKKTGLPGGISPL